jgi:L-threonylcarbamoyladenylate synthase
MIHANQKTEKGQAAEILPPTADGVKRAVDALAQGQIVAFPTETVYGLGADATNQSAVAKIFTAKGRPANNPLIAHVRDMTMAAEIAMINDAARILARSFWPGPLTLILNKGDDSPVADNATAGRTSIAVRSPAHDIAQKLIDGISRPIVAPSANKSGRISATTPVGVMDQLGDDIPFVIAGGACDIGLESTILDLRDPDRPVILRPGAILAGDIEAALNQSVSVQDQATDDPVSPGQLNKHYAPVTPVRLNAVEVGDDEALLAFGSTKFMSVTGQGGIDTLPDGHVKNLSKDGDLYEAAANLFTYLAQLDRTEVKQIAVMPIPDTGIGRAINNRLKRAADGQ